MVRTVLAVIGGYVVMALVVFASFTALYALLGPEGAFEPGTWAVSGTWLASSFALASGAAVVGGAVCRRVAGPGRAVHVLAGLVLALGLVSAAMAMSAEAPDEPRPATVDNTTAMTSAQTPVWVAFVNAVVGAGGVLLGGALVGRRRTRDADSSSSLAVSG